MYSIFCHRCPPLPHSAPTQDSETGFLVQISAKDAKVNPETRFLAPTQDSETGFLVQISAKDAKVNGETRFLVPQLEKSG